MLAQNKVSVGELPHPFGKLTASIQAIFPANLHYPSLQHLKHWVVAQQLGYDVTLALSNDAKEELRWWIAHHDAWNGLVILHSSSDLMIKTDASRQGWKQFVRVWGPEAHEMERKLHLNCLELFVVSLAAMSFTKGQLCVHVRPRMDTLQLRHLEIA